MLIEAVCELKKFRRFMIISTCESFIPREFKSNENIFPEREGEGIMYVEAEDKTTLRQIGEIKFSEVRNVLGIIYNSKSGKTKLKWRSTKDGLGKLTGEASLNTLVNLAQAGIIGIIPRFGQAFRTSRPGPAPD